MKFTVKNEQTKVDDIKVGAMDRSSLVLIGDTEAITCSFIFDTPKSSLIIHPLVRVSGEQPPAIEENCGQK